jgi:hypothetical protein
MFRPDAMGRQAFATLLATILIGFAKGGFLRPDMY